MYNTQETVTIKDMETPYVRPDYIVCSHIANNFPNNHIVAFSTQDKILEDTAKYFEFHGDAETYAGRLQLAHLKERIIPIIHPRIIIEK